jgi:hypothetical protein
MSTAKRQRAPYYQVDDAWKAAILALMEKAGINQAELARRIRCSPGALTLLFKPYTIQSGLVPRIHDVLGLEPPPRSTVISELDDAKRRLDRIWAELSDKERQLLLSVASQFRDPRR